MNLNECNLIGRLTKEVTVKALTSGISVANFSIATNREWTDKNGAKQKATDFHNIVVFGKLADLAKTYLVKGQEVFIKGRLQTRDYEAKDNTKRYITEVVAENIQFGAKPKNYGETEKLSPMDRDGGEAAENSEAASSQELPF